MMLVKLLIYLKIMTDVIFLYFKNIINCFSTIAYDYYYITNFLININNSRLINLLIGDDIFKSIKKLNFDIRKTPQYEIGVNLESKKVRVLMIFFQKLLL